MLAKVTRGDLGGQKEGNFYDVYQWGTAYLAKQVVLKGEEKLYKQGHNKNLSISQTKS